MRSLLFVIAGLCLATLGVVSCGNEGPISPPTHIGDVTIVDDGDGQLIANEPVILSWEFYPKIDYWWLFYSTDGGKHWTPSNKFGSNVGAWKVPADIDTNAFMAKVEGWKDCQPAPRAIAYSGALSVLPFGEIDHFVVAAPEQINSGDKFNVSVTAVDQFGNNVTNYTSEVTIVGSLLTGTPPGVTLNSNFDYTQGPWIAGVTTLNDVTIYVWCMPPPYDVDLVDARLSVWGSSNVTGEVNIKVVPQHS